jgi:RimJ/RimL family protein N-acetyltransferase
MTRRPCGVPLPDPPLAEGGLALRPWDTSDASTLTEAWGDPEIARWTGVPEQADIVAARRWIAGDVDRRARGLSLDLVIEIDGTVVGEVGLTDIDPDARTAEIGWWVAPEHRGAGVASHAARLVADWAVDELCVDAVVARCHRGNPASAGVARAAGFVCDGSTGDVELWRLAPASGATLGV